MITFLTPEQVVYLQGLLPLAFWLLAVIALDLLLGVVVALKAKTFEWQRLADFLTDYGPKLIAWLALECLGLLPAELKTMAGLGSALGTGAYGIILLSAIGSIMGHVQALGLVSASLKSVGLPPTSNIPK